MKLGPISMGERLRIGGDVSSDDDMEEGGTPSPPPGSPKRSHKRRVLPPRSLENSEPSLAALSWPVQNLQREPAVKYPQVSLSLDMMQERDNRRPGLCPAHREKTKSILSAPS